MRDFIDKTSESSGTPLNRDNLMAIQGFENKTISFLNSFTLVETNSKGQKRTIVFENDKVTETFVGEKTITKTTYFGENDIREVIS